MKVISSSLFINLNMSFSRIDARTESNMKRMNNKLCLNMKDIFESVASTNKKTINNAIIYEPPRGSDPDLRWTLVACLTCDLMNRLIPLLCWFPFSLSKNLLDPRYWLLDRDKANINYYRSNKSLVQKSHRHNNLL